MKRENKNVLDIGRRISRGTSIIRKSKRSQNEGGISLYNFNKKTDPVYQILLEGRLLRDANK